MNKHLRKKLRAISSKLAMNRCTYSYVLMPTPYEVQNRIASNLSDCYEYQSIRSNDSFKDSIKKFIDCFEYEPVGVFAISGICEDFGFQRRRFYDVLNVLEAFGCCRKTSVDNIMWFGMKFVPQTLMHLKKISKCDIPTASLNSIFPNEKCIGISHLATSFALCFLALQKRTLGIQSIAHFLSRENGRFKTTLCKLYQIAHILESVGIVEKSSIPGEVSLSPKYFVIVNEDRPVSIESLLNHHSIDTADFIHKRREEFSSYYMNSMSHLLI